MYLKAVPWFEVSKENLDKISKLHIIPIYSLSLNSLSYVCEILRCYSGEYEV
jgi:hypothetical protein